MHGKTQLVCAAATLSEPERALEMQAEYAAVMEKQEAARQKQLADAKARQARQVADAATRPEFKKWIDDDMIERNARFVTCYNSAFEQVSCHTGRCLQRLLLIAPPDHVSNSMAVYGRERQAAEAAEEARRKAEVTAKKAALQAALQSQLQEHTASKQQAAAAQREELANINQSIQVAATRGLILLCLW